MRRITYSCAARRHNMILLFTSLFLMPFGYAQNDPAQHMITLRTTRLAPDLYLIQPPPDSEDGNVMVLCSEEGLLLSDSGLSRVVPQLRNAIELLPCQNKTLKYVIDTHWHLDHAGGNKAFANGGALIIAQDETLKLMSLDQRLLGSTVAAYPESARPVVTFSVALTVHMKNGDVIAEHYPNSHTGGDVVVNFAQQKIQHIGDLYYGAVLPWVDAAHGGTLTGLRRSIERLLQQPDLVTFVPGHGDPVRKLELQTLAKMMDESFDNVKRGISQGLSLKQIQEKGIPDHWKSWEWEGLSTSAWIGNLYDELKKAAEPATSH
jgi:cyclase